MDSCYVNIDTSRSHNMYTEFAKIWQIFSVNAYATLYLSFTPSGDVNNTFPSKLPKFFEAFKKLLRSVFSASKNFGTFMLRVVHKPVQSEQIRLR